MQIALGVSQVDPKQAPNGTQMGPRTNHSGSEWVRSGLAEQAPTDPFGARMGLFGAHLDSFGLCLGFARVLFRTCSGPIWDPFGAQAELLTTAKTGSCDFCRMVRSIPRSKHGRFKEFSGLRRQLQ